MSKVYSMGLTYVDTMNYDDISFVVVCFDDCLLGYLFCYFCCCSCCY